MQRWEIVKEQKACFSCLKRSKGHTASNCLRKKECKEKPMTVPVVRNLTTGFSMATQVLIPEILLDSYKTKAKPFYPLSLPQ
jgi:hypothetical protein